MEAPLGYIEPPAEDTAPEVGALYEADRERLGYVANYTRALAHRPGAFVAWQGLNGAVRASMDVRRYELVTLAAARQLRSSYCMLAHGKILAGIVGPEMVQAIAQDPASAPVDELDRAIMRLAEKVAADATSVTRADIDGLRGLGLADEEVVDIVLAAAMRCFYSKALDALGAEPDAELADMEPSLRDALVVGRPLATA